MENLFDTIQDTFVCRMKMFWFDDLITEEEFPETLEENFITEKDLPDNLKDDMDEVESNIFDLELNLIEYNTYIIQEAAFALNILARNLNLWKESTNCGLILIISIKMESVLISCFQNKESLKKNHLTI